jgi:hypothetical protein
MLRMAYYVGAKTEILLCRDERGLGGDGNPHISLFCGNLLRMKIDLGDPLDPAHVEEFISICSKSANGFVGTYGDTQDIRLIVGLMIS